MSTPTTGPSGVPSLARALNSLALTSLGVGGTIGTGIFVMTGMAAHDVAGPAVIVSFLVAAIACACSALCFAELSARIPKAGSAYIYARTLLGPLGGWVVGWNLLLAYGLAGASVAQGWSHYLQDTLQTLGVPLGIPPLLTGVGGPASAIADLPAALAIIGISLLVVRGIRLSVGINNAIVLLKVGIALLVIGVGLFYIHPENWTPFAPYGWGMTPPANGNGMPQGMLAGAAIAFYAYLGFEAVAAYSEESSTPQKDVPRGILRAVVLCTVLYVAMAAVLTGMVRYNQLSVQAPVSEAFGQVGLPWVRLLVAFGALAGITNVMLVLLMTLPRVLLALSRDGFLPEWVGNIHPVWQTPWKANIVGGAVLMVLATFAPLRALGDLAVLSSLVNFVIVGLLVLKSRRQSASEPLPFSIPGGPIVPVLSIAFSLLLIVSIPRMAYLWLALWWIAGMVLYSLTRRASNSVVTVG